MTAAGDSSEIADSARAAAVPDAKWGGRQIVLFGALPATATAWARGGCDATAPGRAKRIGWCSRVNWARMSMQPLVLSSVCRADRGGCGRVLGRDGSGRRPGGL